MGPLAAMLSGLVMSDIGVTVDRMKRNGAIWAVVLLFLVTSYVFAMVAATVYLSRLYGPLQATCFLAVGTFIVGLIMAAMNARDKRLAAEKRRNSQAQTSLAVATALTIFRKRPLVAAGSAVAIGTLLGLLRKPGRDR